MGKRSQKQKKKVKLVDRILRYFGALTTFGMLVVMIMGAAVTNTGSSQGCGHSWPLCYGKFVPDTMHPHTLIEWSHRLVSGLLGLMIIILAVWAWLRFSRVKGVKLNAVLAVLFVIIQSLLGAGAVVWGQSSIVLAMHFGISLISFASVLLLTVILYEETTGIGRTFPNVSRAWKWNFNLLIIYAYIVIYSGAFVRHTDSALGCLDFPRCNGQWVPHLYSRAGIQYIHRTLALILFVWILVTFLKAVLQKQKERWMVWGTLIAFLSILGQIASGIYVIYTRMALTFLLLHSFFVTVLFGALAVLTMIANRKKTPAYS